MFTAPKALRPVSSGVLKALPVMGDFSCSGELKKKEKQKTCYSTISTGATSPFSEKGANNVRESMPGAD